MLCNEVWVCVCARMYCTHCVGSVCTSLSMFVSELEVHHGMQMSILQLCNHESGSMWKHLLLSCSIDTTTIM